MKTKNLVILRVLLFILLVVGFLALCVFVKRPFQEPEFNVTEKTDLSLDIKISQDDISSCRDFIKNNERYRKPISKAKFSKQINDAQGYLKAHPSGKIAKDLRKTIISELNIGFLLNKINQRELVVKVVTVQQREGFTENELLFKDPQVGTFSVLFLVPDKRKGSCSAIVGLHGHDGSNKMFKDEYFVEELAKKGFAVIMPSFRAMCCDRIEEAISEELYLSGFSFMGWRVYETYLVIKYLKSKKFINKIGIMGHSGGSDVAYLVSIINPNLQALVYDMYPLQLNIFKGVIHCETIPNLAYYSPQINNSATLKIPSLKIGYDCFNQDELRKMTIFFKEKLAEK
ncbi:MAG: hypothetical protein Q7O04_04020 [Candidatus Omnitrophota bacterium]|nr:hypothetical protein [Candidatus Omnitrophota bacterium]